MLSSLLFAVVLLALSAGFMAWHLLAWRRADHGGLGDADFRFYRHQFRRRMQVGAMLGIIGVLSLIDLAIVDVTARALLWSVVLLILLWTVVLAGWDWLASRLHLERQISAQVVERALLQREIEIYRREQEGPAREA